MPTITVKADNGDKQLIDTSSPLLEKIGLAMGDSVQTSDGNAATVLGVSKRGFLWMQFVDNKKGAECYQGIYDRETLAKERIVKLNTRIETSITVITRAGTEQLIHSSSPLLKELGLTMGDRVQTPHGNATVLGVGAQNRLWIQLDNKVGADCYDIRDVKTLAKERVFKLDTPLVKAIRDEDFASATALLQGGASPNGVSSDDGNTCLHWAVKQGNPEVVKLLLEKGGAYQLNVNNKNDETPVLLAVLEKRWECLDILTSKAVNGESTDQLNKALLWVVDENELKIAEKLLNNGAKPRRTFVSSNNGCLHSAIMNNNPAMVSLLVAHGASGFKEKNKNNETPYRLALRTGKWDCVRALEERYLFEIDRDKNTLKNSTSNKKERELAFNNLEKLADQGVVAAKQVVADIYRKEQAPGFWRYLFYGQQRRAKNLYADLAQLTTAQQVESAPTARHELLKKLDEVFRQIIASDAYHSGAAMKFIEQHAKNKNSLVYCEANVFFGIIWGDESAYNRAWKNNSNVAETTLATVNKILNEVESGRQEAAKGKGKLPSYGEVALQQQSQVKPPQSPYPGNLPQPPLYPPLSSSSYQQIMPHVGLTPTAPPLDDPSEEQTSSAVAALQQTLQEAQVAINAIKEKEKADVSAREALEAFNEATTSSTLSPTFDQARLNVLEKDTDLQLAIFNFKTQQLVSAKEALSSVQNAVKGKGLSASLATELNGHIATAAAQITQWEKDILTTETASQQPVMQHPQNNHEAGTLVNVDRSMSLIF